VVPVDFATKGETQENGQSAFHVQSVIYIYIYMGLGMDLLDPKNVFSFCLARCVSIVNKQLINRKGICASSLNFPSYTTDQERLT